MAINRRALYLRHFHAATDLAEEYRRFASDFAEIKKRSLSLTEIDRDRIVRILDFTRSELADSQTFSGINRNQYFRNSSFRRDVERWIENLINVSIDIAKIVLSSRSQRIPQTYRDTLLRLGTITNFNEKMAEKLARLAKLRNILAHEYLDSKYPEIEKFAKNEYKYIKQLCEATDRFLEAEQTTSE